MIYYVLNGTIAVPCTDSMRWVSWYGNAPKERMVAYTRIGEYHVFTVFLSIDHGVDHHGDPVLFETMVFEGSDMGGVHQSRCCTWADAERFHADAVTLVEAWHNRAGQDLSSLGLPPPA